MFSKILVAYDGSKAAEKALATALEFARSDPSIELVFAHVMKIFGSDIAGDAVDQVFIARSQELIEALDQKAAECANPTKVLLLKGSSPATLLVECAKEEGCDLIVMGSRGNGGVRGYLGSVSYGVVQSSPVTVMVTKLPPSAE